MSKIPFEVCASIDLWAWTSAQPSLAMFSHINLHLLPLHWDADVSGAAGERIDASSTIPLRCTHPAERAWDPVFKGGTCGEAPDQSFADFVTQLHWDLAWIYHRFIWFYVGDAFVPFP